ncbi:bifunctional oligoribonuclease/PAP phosphatase NrnA [Psychroflexus sp. YR1-1]|uniref:Bifunctional oligoribonuclease/PAP phosphatase NrnA n=1 Tax=Psychroflexus aurantiacus TaxID=2709310 RepID=A0A6B3QYD2_9FLAO|nr:bifunctional oligoribonuclease/PAP phosphatase NrnA [Psychroflexus aurantiacus]NEV93139.1 bifunctional oligoribonuclease/PAP phosphatase NrnA [Psychroflexus aurantiacus]
MRKKTIEGLKSQLSSNSKVSIIGHKNPDGDALGSTMGLSLFLEQLGISTQVIMPNGFPDFLKWLPGINTVLCYDADKEQCEKKLADSDFVFTLDFNDFGRTGNLGEFLKALDTRFVMIDHHQEPSDYAEFMLVDTHIASTCELVYEFITTEYSEQKLTAEVASCLYTGIMTDTGSFRFPSTTSKTHRIIADLIDAGAKNSQIHQDIYDNNAESRLHLLGQALQNLKVLEDFNTAYTYLTQDDLNTHGFKKGDTEGFVNYALSLKGIRFAVIFIENKAEEIIKISFRSIGDFDVNTFARAHYHGGGHKNAAGGKSDLDLKSTLTEFENRLDAYKEKLS